MTQVLLFFCPRLMDLHSVPHSLPTALTRDAKVGERFISHYFSRASHHPVDNVRLALDGDLEKIHTEGETGKLGRPKGLMTLTNRDSWHRLRRESDRPTGRTHEKKRACELPNS